MYAVIYCPKNSLLGDCGLEGIRVCSGGGFSLLWPIRECAAGQGMVFDLSSSVLVISCESVLNKIYNFALVCHLGIRRPFLVFFFQLLTWTS